jgi:hypothetical protein
LAIDHGLAFNMESNNAHIKMFEKAFKENLDRYQGAKNPAEKAKALLDVKNMSPTKEVYNKMVETSETKWRQMLTPFLPKEKIIQFIENRRILIKLYEDAAPIWRDQAFTDGPTSPLIRRTNTTEKLKPQYIRPYEFFDNNYHY